MMKSAMRSALKESLVGMKKGMRNARAKSHMANEEDGEDAGDSEGAPSGSTKGVPGLAQGKGLSGKVGDAEDEGMKEMDSRDPAAAEPQTDDSWREEQKDFMKNRSKPSGKKTAFAVAVASGKGGGKQKAGGKFGKKG